MPGLIEHLINPENVEMPPEILEAGRYKKGDLVVLRNPEINGLPFPFMEGEAGRYLYNGLPMSFLITSRGCPYHCSFCGIHSVFGQKYRRRKNEEIIREIRELFRHERAGVLDSG
jgi:radical SAM superfamily enzyme YgiQ (UPF0313 family)